MSELLRFLKDMRDNGYGLAEIAAQLGTSAIAEPVAGYAAMYDPVHGADAIREGMTYQPRSQAAAEYQSGIGNAVQKAAKPVMPIIDAWKRGVDIAGSYNPYAGAVLKTVPTAIGVALGAKPALQQGRAIQERLIANANAPRTLNTGYMGQRGAAGVQSEGVNIGEKPQRVMSETAKKAYDLGVKHRKMLEENPDLTLLHIAYMSDDAENALTDAIYKKGYELSAAAYESGRRGANPPVLATGLRYGKAPESGFSINKATGESEHGVSMAKVDGVDYEWYPVSDSKSARKPIKYEGWLLDPNHFWGSDGEPLMIKPIENNTK